MPEGVHFERLDKPTPNGGAYSILYWMGRLGTRATRETAVGGEIVEYTKDGKVLHRTYFSNRGSYGGQH